MRIAIVVKYYPPLERVSGIIGYLTVLNRHLAREVDLHVITSRPRGERRRTVAMDGYTVHLVRGPFPVAAGRQVRRLRPDTFVFASGIFDLRLAGPYVEAFNQVVHRSGDGLFLQATNIPDDVPRTFHHALRPYRRVLAASPMIGQALEPAVGDRLTVLPPAVEIPPPAATRTGPTRVGFVNHLSQVKGADLACDLIDATLSERPDVEAFIAGTGPLSQAVVDRFAGRERVQVAGFLGEQERLRLIASCDVMLLPFRTAVSVLGVSQTVLEVMAAGNVVVGSDTDAISAAVEHGRTGLLGAPEALGPLLHQLLQDPDHRDRLGAEARAAAANYWDVATRAQRVLELLSA